MGHFDGHGSAPVPYEAHHPMQHDQGFTESPWTPPSGNYLLCIAPAAARATINTTKMQHVPTLLAILMAITMRRYYTAHTARWRRLVAFIKATKRHHRASTRSDRHQPDMPTLFVSDISLHKRARFDMLDLITIGVWHIKLMRSMKHLTNLPEYFVGLGWLMQYLTVISIVFYGVSLPIITQNIYKIRHRTS